MMNLIVNKKGELKEREVQPQLNDVLDVLKNASHITVEKLDRSIEFYNKKRIAPKGFKIAGIDPRRSGEQFTYEEGVEHEKKVKALFTEREAIKKAVNNFDAYIMPTTVFVEIRKRLGLFMLEPSLYDDWYVADNDTDSLGYWGKLPFWDFIQAFSIVTLVTFFGSVIGAGTLWYYICDIPILSVISPFLFIPIVTIYIPRYILRKRKKEHADQKKLDATLERWFPSLVLSNGRESGLSLRNIVDRKTKTAIQISIPQPDPKTQHLMEEVFTAIPKNKGWKIWTVAAPESIGFTIQRGKKPEPAREPRREDPGLIVQYNNYVAVLPDTWYHVSPLEQSFIDEVMQVAEQWDARAYLAN